MANDGAIYWKEVTKPDRIPQLKPIIIVSIAGKIIWDTFKNSANYAGKFALKCVNRFSLIFIIDPQLTNPELKEDWKDETY
ncbi:MAG: hypothetical protein L6Q78_04965 [Bacteroidia bacterium]|nr:hypothetical protein [Bacteroidia bacterium]